MDLNDIVKLAGEAKEKWGDTPAFKEFEKKMPKAAEALDVLLPVFKEFGEIKDTEDPKSAAAQAIVKLLQKTITEKFFECSPEILGSLGKMYTSDARFTKNIDEIGGEGTAEFASKAIEFFCKQK